MLLIREGTRLPCLKEAYCNLGGKGMGTLGGVVVQG